VEIYVWCENCGTVKGPIKRAFSGACCYKCFKELKDKFKEMEEEDES